MAIDKDEIWGHAVRVWRLGSETLSRLKDKVDRDAWHRCVQVLADCRGRIVTSGVGTSGAAAKKLRTPYPVSNGLLSFCLPMTPSMGLSERLRRVSEFQVRL